MTFDPWDQGYRVPTSAEASQMLREITPVSRRTSRLARDVTLARPLLAWGLAWIASSVMYQFMPAPAGAVCGAGGCVVAGAVSWLVRPREVQLGTERQLALLWGVLFATSPLMVIVIAPPDAQVTVTFLASFWAVGMLMYGVGTTDMPLAVVGLLTLLTAAAARLLVPSDGVLAVGIAGGAGMAALGAWRMRWKS